MLHQNFYNILKNEIFNKYLINIFKIYYIFYIYLIFVFVLNVKLTLFLHKYFIII